MVVGIAARCEQANTLSMDLEHADRRIGHGDMGIGDADGQMEHANTHCKHVAVYLKFAHMRIG